jgi:hypothetical protein
MRDFTYAQYREIKGRQRFFSMSEEEKWQAIYRILFPDCDLEELPSACK